MCTICCVKKVLMVNFVVLKLKKSQNVNSNKTKSLNFENFKMIVFEFKKSLVAMNML